MHALTQLLKFVFQNSKIIACLFTWENVPMLGHNGNEECPQLPHFSRYGTTT